MPSFVAPQWPAPARVRALASTRVGGVSATPYDSLNLGSHVGDAPADVETNRRRLAVAARLPAPARWLRQVHGHRVVDLDLERSAEPDADGAVTARPGTVCAIQTADCLPILLCDRAGTRVGALHAGWRGLAAGVIENGIAAMDRRPADLLAWLGPAIGGAVYEVGAEVRSAFVDGDPGCTEAFVPRRPGHWLCDLAGLARRRLAAAGVGQVYACGRCTLAEPGLFFSHRRDGTTGRMATLIWLADPD